MSQRADHLAQSTSHRARDLLRPQDEPLVVRDDTPSGAFERADNAICWAKGNGRNRVCIQAELLAIGETTDQARSGEFELF